LRTTAHGSLTQLAMNLPALVLSLELSGLAWLIVFRGVWATFIHSNVRLPICPLRYLIGAPELHHWHHARAERAELECDGGRVLRSRFRPARTGSDDSRTCRSRKRERVGRCWLEDGGM
jgi:hypothetical protein